MSGIEEALTRLFGKNRIIFWYDAEREMREAYESLQVPGVEKLEILNNQLAIKHRILREAPNQKFLLYHEGPQPRDLDNWLLDVQLANCVFRADQIGLWLSELGLDFHFAEVLRNHRSFFASAKRMDALKKILGKADTPALLELKMLAICTDSEPRIDEILLSLLAELAEEREERQRLVDRAGLWGVFWKQLKVAFGYEPEKPSLKGFLLDLFLAGYERVLGEGGSLNADALVFLKHWKDSKRHGDSFRTLSDLAARDLSIEKGIASKDYRELMELDLFRCVDMNILGSLLGEVEQKTLSAVDCAEFVRLRRQGHWFGDFEDLYEAILCASRFFQALGEADLSIGSLGEGVQRYARSWHLLDQLYRQYCYHARKSGERSLLESLSQKVENLYVNVFLLPLNDSWQSVLDRLDAWKADEVYLQRDFYRHWVEPFTAEGKKVVVIISDALRYELGQELLTAIRKEDRYEAKLEPMLAMLPSFTQLGMASLLPNREIAFLGDGAGTVMVDGRDSRGLANREKILQATLGPRGKTVKAEDFLAMNGDEARALLKDCEVLYIYHNRIDAAGGSVSTEDTVFEAAEQTLTELVRLAKKLTAANASNILVTADHGFLFQSGEVHESDFTDLGLEGTEILMRDRRFILGRGLKPNSGLWGLDTGKMGLEGDVQVRLARSIKRLRLTGATIRFVHGGGSLQEVVLPVIHINKKRKSDVSQVEVDIIKGTSTLITSGQLSVSFFQVEPVTEKRKARRLRAGIYSLTGELLSDLQELDFNLDSPEMRARERSVRFILTKKAEQFNGQEVFLRLDELIPDTSHYREYRSVRYTVRRAITSDFDF